MNKELTQEPKTLPVYTLDLTEFESNLSLGIGAVAIVDAPAIMRAYQMFAEQKKQTYQITNSDRQIVSGYIMIADLPIYRRDEMGEYYMIYTPTQIEMLRDRFHIQNKNNSVNLMHDETRQVQDIYMIESFIVDESRGIQKPLGFDGATNGSWFVSYKITNPEMWEKIKTDPENFTGFSVEGFLPSSLMIADKNETILKEIIDVINSIDVE